MAEDFTTYTEVDPNSRITVTTSKVTWAGLARNEDAYVYTDKGVDYFYGNFNVELTVRETAETGGGGWRIGHWSIANLVDDLEGIDVAGGDYLAVMLYTNSYYELYLVECDGGTLYYSSPSSYVISVDTDYYLTVVRNESVGTYGTLYCYVYSDSDRATLLHTFTIALHSSKKKFRYLYACHSHNVTGQTMTCDGYTENMEISARFGETSGVISIVEERFHYVDAYGVERYVQGTVVP